MIDRDDVIEYVEETYNDCISVYDHSNYIRVTNGSAAHKADLRLQDGRLEVRAERYGETYSNDHDPTLNGLKAALSNGLGL